VSEIRVSRIVSALLSKGFETYQGHHAMYRLVVEGKTTSIRTRISHGQRRADDWLLRQIAKQLHLSKQELMRFIDCAMGAGEYRSLMTERGHARP